MATTTWVIDPTHSEIQFKVKHLVISTVTGSFGKFEGQLETGKDDFSDASISFTADINSISTANEQRDQHLKGEDFFDATHHPKLSFRSTSFTKTGENEYKLIGDLTMKGTTKQVALQVEYGGTQNDFYGNTKSGFEITGKINRKDFGLTWTATTEAGGIVVSDEVRLVVNVQLIKK
ncbi:MAG: YceI family protein [Bacteroidota bacterium]